MSKVCHVSGQSEYVYATNKLGENLQSYKQRIEKKMEMRTQTCRFTQAESDERIDKHTEIYTK